MNGLVEQRVKAVLIRPNLDGALRAAVDAAWRAQHAPAKPNGSQKQRKRLEGIIARARQRIDVATDRYLDDALTKAEYDHAVCRYTREIEQTEANLTSLVGPVRPAADGIKSNLPAMLRIMDDLGDGFAGDDVARRRDILRELIVQIAPTRLGYGDYRLDIAWTPLGEALGWLAEHVAEPFEDEPAEPTSTGRVVRPAVA
jgi:hypothetical protein